MFHLALGRDELARAASVALAGRETTALRRQAQLGEGRADSGRNSGEALSGYDRSERGGEVGWGHGYGPLRVKGAMDALGGSGRSRPFPAFRGSWRRGVDGGGWMGYVRWIRKGGGRGRGAKTASVQRGRGIDVGHRPGDEGRQLSSCAASVAASRVSSIAARRSTSSTARRIPLPVRGAWRIGRTRSAYAVIRRRPSR